MKLVKEINILVLLIKKYLKVPQYSKWICGIFHVSNTI